MTHIEPTTAESLVHALAPVQEEADWKSFLAKGREHLVEPFSNARLATLGRLSAAILKHPALRRDASSVALAYWLRTANLRRLREEAESRHLTRPHVIARPAGLVFHLAPANVDTMFVYSWALAYLCGNTSLLRLSQDQTEITRGLLECLNQVMQENADLAGANRFVTYAHDAEITATISASCALRVVWGGDETVTRIRAIPLSPHASERVFPTKYSYSTIQADKYLAATDQERAALAERFHADLFPFDQMGCSSPHAILWVGGQESFLAAAQNFNAALTAEISRRHDPQAMSLAVQRRNFAFEMAAEDMARFDATTDSFTAIYSAQEEVLRPHSGGGLFSHARVDSLAALAAIGRESDQTVGHFGFSAEELAQLGHILGDLGVDRIVPIGQALAFETTWDGFDLIADFLRFVVVRSQ